MVLLAVNDASASYGGSYIKAVVGLYLGFFFLSTLMLQVSSHKRQTILKL